ncbi:uncharacterized protein LOC125746328 isoform X2 [Brienomyrus brachyistius]|uniref:uncharacterized protein LOC125746328 isoform X2 n=1 Tax=Brienomyrus brachyistius TaxID=42636 RepID=UPI0020B1AD49|nr:uncharacterized protein LOC125746328 isoform X2 [Brienomyrus brachyistius]
MGIDTSHATWSLGSYLECTVSRYFSLHSERFHCVHLLENYNLTEPRPGQSEKMEAISHRAECLGGKKKNCTLKISNTRKTDAGEYRFRFRSNAPRGQWTGQSGVKLYVHELRVVMTSSGVNGTLREGDSVNLTCDTGNCSHSQSEFTWFKDKQLLSDTQSTLQFDPVSYHHFGKYSCALKGHTETVSDAFILNAQYDSHMTTTLVIVGVVLFVLVVVFLVAIVVKRMKGSRLRKETSRTVKTQIADEHVHVPGTESTHPPSMALGLDTSPREEGVSYAALHFDTKPPVKRPVETEQTQQESVIYSSVLTATNRVK